MLPTLFSAVVENTVVEVLPKLKVINNTRSSTNFATKVDNPSVSFSLPRTFLSTNDSDSEAQTPSRAGRLRKTKRKRRCNVSKASTLEGESKAQSLGNISQDVKLPQISHRSRKRKSAKSTPRQPILTVPSRSKVKAPTTPDPSNGSYVENEYTRFTVTEKFPASRKPIKKQGVSIIRSQRLFHLTKQLRKCHSEYNKYPDLQERDHFLTYEILQRYIMALDLALAESYLGIALEIVHRMYDATKYMIPLYSNIFYHLDGRHAPLPIFINGRHDFNRSVGMGPVICALNRIPLSSSSPDKNGHLRLETHLMKLQLEVLMLVIAPVESAVFRANLEVLPNTAFTAYQRLVSLKIPSTQGSIRWQNDSVIRKEYAEILEKFGLADQLGCKGSLATINSTLNSPSKSSRKVNCDSEFEMSDGEASDL